MPATATDLRVADLMTIDPIVTSVDASIEDAEELLRHHRISGLPVVDADRFGIGSATVMTTAERTLERSLALEQGVLICPRAGSVVLATCDGCPFFCRTETERSSVICSYPIPARETFATRSRHSEALRIALRHQLERT